MWAKLRSTGQGSTSSVFHMQWRMPRIDWITCFFSIIACLIAVAAIVLAAVYIGETNELREDVDDLQNQAEDDFAITGISGFDADSSDMGAAGTQFSRNIQPPSGSKRDATFTEPASTTNERLISVTISDAVCAAVATDCGLRRLAADFGQLMDHDLVLSVGSGGDLPQIVINVTGDPVFGSFADPAIRIDARGVFPDEHGRKQFVNAVTHWLDASFLYGSNEGRTLELRSFRGGKLKVYPHQFGDLLPINIAKLPQNERVPDNAQNGHACGDVRCAEQPNLFALHTVFMLLHNRLASEVADAHDSWSDEQIFQWARHTVRGIFQRIVYEEWLPAVLGEPFDGIDDSYSELATGPLDLAFAFAAFRFGHSLMPNTIDVATAPYSTPTYVVTSTFDLADTFFKVDQIYAHGIKSLIFGALNQDAQKLDTCVVPALQDELFLNLHPDKAMDLLAINIARGREVQLPTFNDMRTALGLTPYTTYLDLTGDASLAATLSSLYMTNLTEVATLDLFVGFIAEKHLPDKCMGETLHTFFKYQFQRLASGDPAFYARGKSSGLRQDQLDTIFATNFKRVLHATLGIDNSLLPNKIFVKT